MAFTTGLRYAVIGGLLAFLASACSHPAARQLEGRWFGDGVENFNPDDIAVATGWVRGMSFEFSAGRLTVSVPAEEPRTGRFEVVASQEHDVVIDVVGNGNPGGPMEFTLLEGGMLRWKLDSLRSILLRRE
jgi:hypothetical protein